MKVNFPKVKVLINIYIHASLPVYVFFLKYIFPSWKAEMNKAKIERE